MKILIVDDDPLSQITLKATLAPFGECVCAGNGREGVDLFTLALDDIVANATQPVLREAAVSALLEQQKAFAKLPAGVAFVASDEKVSGTLQTQHICKLLNGKGTVLVLISRRGAEQYVAVKLADA